MPLTAVFDIDVFIQSILAVAELLYVLVKKNDFQARKLHQSVLEVPPILTVTPKVTKDFLGRMPLAKPSLLATSIGRIAIGI